MKKISISKIIFSLAAMTIMIAACTKEDPEVRLDPKLSTSQVLSVKSDSATVVGFVVAAGNGFSERGVCYGLQAHPTLKTNKVIYNGTEPGATFSVILKSLQYATKYYARAYALNAADTLYGEELTFTTLPVVPTVTTSAFTATSGTSANGGGNVTNNGGAAVTARGVVYSKTSNPTLSDSKTTDGTGSGVFTSSLSNLKGLTKYYVRAYATNSAGTAYGPEVSFTTPEAIVTLYIAGDFQGWDPANAKDSLMNTADDPTVQGYAYISNTNGFKFVSQHDWNGTNYGAGTTAGTISTTGDNLSVSSAGYYLFKINLANLTYTATKTTWGVIGAATAGGWGSDQAMTYSPTLRRWFATIPLTADQLKFRANGAWDLNYGDTGNDGKLDAGGDNINVATAGTYSVMLDLSAPLKYKYALTKWSIIGDAAGGWSNDVDMVPHANNTWTLTTTLAVGDLKFRANHDWTINLGGTPSKFTFGGDNIKITTPGTYTITLDLNNGTYTIQ